MDESFLRIKGKRVSEKSTNKYFGRLSDILVNKDTNQIIGIIVKNNSLIYKHRFFYMKDICAWDEVNVFVEGYGEKFVKIVPLITDYKSCENDIFKRKAILSDGSEVGKVQNITLSFETGTITGFEVGSSIVQDLLTGRKICPTKQKINFFQGKILLDEE